MDNAASDLIALLGVYAAKQNSAIITIESFVQSVITAVEQKKTDVPGIGSFLHDTKNKIYKMIDELVKEERVFMEEGGTQKIYFPSFYYEKIYNAYEHIDTSIETSFPTEANLSIYNLQKDHVRYIDILNNFAEYISKRDEKSKIEIVRLVFSEGYGNIITISTLLPKRILQIAILKLRDYLYRYGNSDFFLKKLINYFVGKEPLVLDYFKNITAAPEKSIASIISGNNFSTSFWSYLYSLIKQELHYQQTLNGKRSIRDIALYQASTIILACNNYYTTISLNERDKALIFSTVENEMDKPPYYYTFDEIQHFKTSPGRDILDGYTLRDLTAYIKTQLKPGDDNTMPPILVFHGQNKETWYAKKSKAIDLCEKLITDATVILRKSIEDRWKNILKNYYTENTMRDDFVFEELIRHFASEEMPQLVPVLREPKLEFVLEELKANGVQFRLELFRYGEPLPLRKILGFEKEAILFSIRASLPLRYSIKFIVKIIAFIKHGTNSELIFTKKTKRNKAVEAKPKENNRAHIDNLVKNLISEGESLDSELDALAEKWNHLFAKSEREKLRENVNGCINANLNFVLKTLKFGVLTVSILEDIAGSLIASNTVLKSIHDKKLLQRYITLYMLKLLKAK
jgi:hypothetical protein